MATIRKRGENTYQFIASAGLGADNKYKRKYKTYRVTEKMTPKQLDAHLKHEAYKFEQKILSDSYIAPTEMSFKQFSIEWTTKWLEKEVSENTISLRLGSLKNHIMPLLGHLSIKKVTTLMLLDLMNNLSRKDGRKGELSVSTKQEVHKALGSVFQRAVEWNVIKNNPMEGVKMPVNNNNQEKKLRVYDTDEVDLLMRALQNQDQAPHWRLFMSLALATGMRRGELLALEWKHIDLENQLIDIQQMISRKRKGVELKAPKFNSKRVISIPASLVHEFKEYKKHSNKEKSHLQIKDNIRNWVFFNNKGNHFYPTTPSTWWVRFLVRVNKQLESDEKTPLPIIRLHDLRHTSATLLISDNVHPKIISERIGHKKISTTMDIYGHALPSADREASEKLNHIFESKD